MTIALLLLATACRHHRELSSSRLHADSVAALAAIRLASLDSEEWEQTVILHADSLGNLVPAEAVVRHRTTRSRTNDTSEVVTAMTVDRSSVEEEVRETQPTAPASSPCRKASPMTWLAIVLLCVSAWIIINGKRKTTWKLRN